ncbi:MAG: hypothetical protein HYV78_00390 [Candidatus Wildermuthbacteria bacterium]|nr:hypothetical protein [Candidatus Wildermuthbacteria bacterium]
MADGKRALVPRNPDGSLSVDGQGVTALARRLKWSPEALVRRIQDALPAPLEQQVYLEVALSLRLRRATLPETFGKIFRELIGERKLTARDLEDRVVGENLVVNTMVEVGDYLAIALELLERFWELGVRSVPTVRVATKLAMAYGEHAVDIVEMVENNLHAILRGAGVRSRLPLPAWMGIILGHIAEHATQGGGGVFCVRDFDDVIELLNKYSLREE